MTQTNSNLVVDDYAKYVLLDYRQKLLRGLLVVCIIILLGLTVFHLIGWLPAAMDEFERFDLADAGIAIVVLLILLWMNQRGHVLLVGWMFCLFVFASIFVSCLPSQFSRTLLMMALPVVVSGLTIQPWTSFLFAGLTISIYTWIYFQSGDGFAYDIFSIVILLILAIGSYLVSNILNKSISDSVHAYD